MAALKHQVTKTFLGDKTINGCNACRWVKPCVQKDDMQAIYSLYIDCGMAMLASPLYFGTISARLKAFLERLYAVAEEDDNPPKGRYEKHAKKDCALLMTATDDFFWTFEQAVSYYRFNCVNYLGWPERCDGSPTKRHIEDTSHLEAAYVFGKNL